MFKEFKEFIMRGNVMDMAVGVVMGAAFKAIIDSLVADIIMPLIGLVTAGVDFTNLKIVLKAAAGENPEVALTYGNLIQVIINFLLVALCVFLMVKGINKLYKKKEAAPEEAPAKSDEVILLEQIRDALNK